MKQIFFRVKGERKLCLGLEKLMFVIFDFEIESKRLREGGCGSVALQSKELGGNCCCNS
jgi:hypothetical protein